MRCFAFLVSLLAVSFVVCSNNANYPGPTHIYQGDNVHTISSYVSHGPFVFEVGTPPPGVDAELYYRIVQRIWDMVIERKMSNAEVLHVLQHSNSISDSIAPQLLSSIRPVVQRAVKEAKKLNTARHKRSLHRHSDGDDSEPFMDVPPREDRYLSMLHEVKETVKGARDCGKITQRQFQTMNGQIQALYQLPRRNTEEMRTAIMMCASVCADIHTEILGG